MSMWITWFQEVTTTATSEASSWTFADVSGALGASFACGALLATIFYGEIQRRLTKRQLELSEEEAKRRPDLEVEGVYLVAPDESEYVRDKLTTAERRITKPDDVVRVMLHNHGKVAAFNTMGTIEFDPPIIGFREDMLQEDAMVLKGSEGDYGIQRCNVLIGSGRRPIDIPVYGTPSGTTVKVKCRFSTPMGSSTEKTLHLEFPSR